ncbi:MAG: FtsX-like permease family protein [Ruminococcaceae bacterium]|nr:FtsX-like permease family protein [Oscillospiraceae bacterium]
MKINNIGYLLKEGIRGIFLHGFRSFVAVFITVASLIVVGVFACLTYNVSLIIQDLNKTNEVLVFVDETYTDAEARSVGTLINKVENVHKATFVSREEALEDFIADHGGSEAFVGVDANPLRHRYVVQLQDNSQITKTVAQLERVKGVAKISAAYELAEGFTTLQNVLQVVSVMVTGILLIVSLLMISNTVKLAMYDRKDEIFIMKMVGATNNFIRMPYVVEGFILGMTSAALALGLLWVLYDWMLAQLSVVDTMQLLDFVPFDQLLVPMSITFGGAGLLVGVTGGGASIRKFMNV